MCLPKIKDFNRYIKFGFLCGLTIIIVIAISYSCTSSSSSYTSNTPVALIQSTKPITIKPIEELPTSLFDETTQPTKTYKLTNTVEINQTEEPVTSVFTETNHSIEISPLDPVWQMLGQVNEKRVLTDLQKLTGGEPICSNDKCYSISNRLTGSKGLQWAKKYIYEELVNVGYSLEFFDWSASGYSDQNLIAWKQGVSLPDEKIYFVAHLDGVKKGLIGRFPAADDNATGVVDLLELARILSNNSFSRTIVLFFSTGEELGTLGVKSYLSQLTPEEISSIKYVVNIDMIGYDANNDKVMELWHADDPASMALTEVMSEIIKAKEINLLPKLVVGCG